MKTFKQYFNEMIDISVVHELYRLQFKPLLLNSPCNFKQVKDFSTEPFSPSEAEPYARRLIEYPSAFTVYGGASKWFILYALNHQVYVTYPVIYASGFSAAFDRPNASIAQWEGYKQTGKFILQWETTTYTSLDTYMPDIKGAYRLWNDYVSIQQAPTDEKVLAFLDPANKPQEYNGQWGLPGPYLRDIKVKLGLMKAKDIPNEDLFES